MARSQYIYLVTQAEQPVAAFTVKHELVTWMGRNPAQGQPYVVRRLHDGGYGAEPQVIEVAS